MFEQAGRVAIVTGAGSGIGRAIALGLGRVGADVVIADMDGDAAARVAESISAGERRSLALQADVTSRAQVEACVQRVIETFGRIDVLVNNAGVAYSGPAEDETPEHVQDLVETNLTGLFALSRLVGRRMLAQGGGVVVNIASPSATVSLDRYGLAGYAATKAAVVALTRELAAQWGRRGVRVNALAPSWFPTATTGWLQDPDQVAWICAHTPLGRPPRPDELDGPLLFLAGDASSYVTGQTLYVDGGWTCR